MKILGAWALVLIFWSGGVNASCEDSVRNVAYCRDCAVEAEALRLRLERMDVVFTGSDECLGMCHLAGLEIDGVKVFSNQYAELLQLSDDELRAELLRRRRRGAGGATEEP